MNSSTRLCLRLPAMLKSPAEIPLPHPHYASSHRATDSLPLIGCEDWESEGVQPALRVRSSAADTDSVELPRKPAPIRIQSGCDALPAVCEEPGGSAALKRLPTQVIISAINGAKRHIPHCFVLRFSDESRRGPFILAPLANEDLTQNNDRHSNRRRILQKLFGQ